MKDIRIFTISSVLAILFWVGNYNIYLLFYGIAIGDTIRQLINNKKKETAQ